MLTDLRCIQVVLYWCYDQELYLSAQSTRSWAYFGDEHLTLRFTLPPLPRVVSGLRLSIQPCPIGLTIQSMRFYSADLANIWTERDVKISAFGTLDARISPYAEPASSVVKGTCASIKANATVLKKLSKGGTLELVLSLSFSNELSYKPNNDLEFKLSSAKDSNEKGAHLNPATSRELQEMHNEVMILGATIKDFYGSNTWKWTKWCRDISTLIRGWPFWKVYLIVEKQIQNSLNKPLKALAYSKTKTEIIDVIVPVYNNIEYLERCLKAIFESSSNAQYEIIVVDDASYEKEVIEYLDKLQSIGTINLLRNKINSGFTKAVNQGMGVHPNRDIVLLNSDTVVSNNWLDRLHRAAYSKEKIGTVTPFSNNASICSYPYDGTASEILPGYDIKSLDALFAATNNGNLVKIPTAVGFCMYIKRKCLKQVGYFDSEAFPGYGEENDFCMRAHKLGWWHILAADTYVYHEGGSSYGESQHKRKRAAYEFVTKMHPEFQELINDFVRLDSALPFRRNIDLKRLQSAHKPIILLLLHSHGGGTEKHVLELAKFFGEQVDFLSLRVFGEHAQLRWLNEGEGFNHEFIIPAGYDDLRDLLKQLPIQRIHIHHILGLESIISNLILDLGLPFDFTVHDFYTVCPRGWLCDYRQHYCGQPDEDSCNACLTALPDPKTVKIQQWRKQYSWLIEKAQRIFVPSKDTLVRLHKYLPTANYIVAPHLDSNLANNPEPLPLNLLPGEPLRIVVLGLLNAEKGSNLLDACAIDALERKLPLEFHFLGAAHRPLSGRPHGAMLIYGRYNDANLQDLLQQVRPHLAWFPAQCPETYSYTLSACLEAGLPVVAPDLGAFPERLAGRDWSWIRSWQQTPEQWNDFFVNIMNDHFKTTSVPNRMSEKESTTHFSYVKDYLQPCIANHSQHNLQQVMAHSRL